MTPKLNLPGKYTNDPGTYVLLANLAATIELQIGSLGTFVFPQGYYLYFGSALNGLNGRIARHLRSEKKLHWHIDYLLDHASIEEVWGVRSEEKLECLWAREALALRGCKIFAGNFGSSDCRCRSHLLFFKHRPSLRSLNRALKTQQKVHVFPGPIFPMR